MPRQSRPQPYQPGVPYQQSYFICLTACEQPAPYISFWGRGQWHGGGGGEWMGGGCSSVLHFWAKKPLEYVWELHDIWAKMPQLMWPSFFYLRACLSVQHCHYTQGAGQCHRDSKQEAGPLGRLLCPLGLHRDAAAFRDAESQSHYVLVSSGK